MGNIPLPLARAAELGYDIDMYGELPPDGGLVPASSDDRHARDRRHQQVVAEAEFLSQGKHPITLTCSEELELAIMEADLHSAIGNLVTNAIRHNPQGASITLTAERLPQQLTISVSDNGVGIDPIAGSDVQFGQHHHIS